MTQQPPATIVMAATQRAEPTAIAMAMRCIATGEQAAAGMKRPGRGKEEP
jgi:hypothetical protein